MTLPGQDELRRLLAWEPAGGVLSVSVVIDPGDRGGGWLVALEDALRPVHDLAESAPHDQKIALRTVTGAVLERFNGNGPPPEGRGQVGFVEVARKDGREEWHPFRIPPRRTEVVYGHRPYLRPVVEISERGTRMGVAAVSGDKLRLWEWELGELSERGDEALTPAAEPRERSAQRVEAHRDRFLKQAASRSEQEAAERGWVELLAFGEVEHVSRFKHALGGREPKHVESANVVAEPTARIAERVERLLPELIAQRELGLIESVKEAAYKGRERASLGPQETLEALAAGRVERLAFDAERDYRGQGIEQGLAYDGPPLGEDGLPVAELMIERALETGAGITPVVGDAASALDEHDGVAALLRY